MISNSDFNGKKFPHTESDKFEFKESIGPKSFDKYIQTICGFLNTGGGNLIFGIKDNLNLLGLNSTKQKELDNFILRFDSIINEKQIIGLKCLNNYSNDTIDNEDKTDKLNTEQVVCLSSSNIKINQVKSNSGKIFLWIEVIPEHDVKYQLANGMVYHRLGASNYFEKTERIYKQNDFESACRQIQKNAELENKSNIELFQQTLNEKNKHIELLNKKIKQVEETNQMYEKYLANTIKNQSQTQSPDIENQTNKINTTNSTNSNISNSNQIVSYDYNKLFRDIIYNVFPCFK
jgi:hypothetical protein